MNNKIFILGSHPLKDSIKKQYAEKGYKVDENEELSEINFSDYHEIVLLPSGKDDNATLERMKQLAIKANKGNRPIVHLLLQSPTTLWLLQTTDLPEEVNEAFDVYPFTMEDVWAKNLFVHLPGKNKWAFPRLDRIAINAESKQMVHLVVSGFDSLAEAVAIHAALIAHFPNYNGKDEVPLRTRITIIDKDICGRRDNFIARYQNLFDNSFYRTICIDKRQSDFHKPRYYGKREDFVDVEWEFVDSSVNDAVVRGKLKEWVLSESRQLTIVVSNDDDDTNLSQCVSLPNEIYERGIPVMVRQRQSGLSDSIKSVARYKNVYPFGMLDCGYDVTLPLVKMAKLLNYFYDCSYNDKKGVPTVLPREEVDEAWRKVQSYKMRFSNIYNVMTISTKMHTLGHDDKDVERFYALTSDEIRSLAETEHNRWSVERLIMGSRPCTDEEQKTIRENIAEIIRIKKNGKGGTLPEDKKKWFRKTRDVHYDLRAYDELEVDATGKNAQVYDYDLTACIPLIAKTFYDESNGRE